MKYSAGASLLEVMVALLLSAILLIAIFNYSLFLEKAMNFSASKVDSIEKNNVLFAWLVHDVEMAGYVGCVNAQARKKIIDDGGYLTAAWLNINHDQLYSQYLSTPQLPVKRIINTYELIIPATTALKAGDIVLIENCWEAEATKIKTISPNEENNTQKKVQLYDSLNIQQLDYLYMAKLIQRCYFIEKTTRKNADGSWISALYGREAQQSKQEILDNVMAMRLLQVGNKIIITVSTDNESAPIILTGKMYNASA